MSIVVTPFYAALLALFIAALGTMVSLGRGKYDVALGSGASAPLELMRRRFGNQVEWVPLALLMLLLMELGGTGAYWLNAYGTVLVALRLLHAVVLFDTMEAPLWKKAGRFVAAAGTAMLVIAAAITLLIG